MSSDKIKGILAKMDDKLLKYIALAAGTLAVVLFVLSLIFGGKSPYLKVLEDMEGPVYLAAVEAGTQKPVLLVTRSVFDYQGQKATTDCDVYYQVKGKAQYIGRIHSAGTAYPITYDEKGIYATTEYGRGRYEISKDGTLTLAESSMATFDQEGNATYICEENGEITVLSLEEWNTLVQSWWSAPVVYFSFWDR